MQNEITSDSTLKNVTSIDHTEGAAQAYKKLKSDYDTYSKSHTSKETADYWDAVNKGLVASKTIGDLSIGWASENATTYGEGDGSFNKGDLRSVNKAVTASATDLDVSLSAALADGDMYSKVANLAYDIDGNKSISQADIQVYMKRNADAVEQNKTLKFMEPLMAGQPPLFKILDTVGSQHSDQKISQEDLQKYLNDYDDNITKAGRAPEADGQKYSQKNHDYVQKLYDNWDSKDVKRLRGKFLENDVISLTSLGDAAKMRDVDGGKFDVFYSRFNALYEGLKNDDVAPAKAESIVVPPPAAVTTAGINGDTGDGYGATGPAEFNPGYSAPPVDVTAKF
ncbi:MAG: hypothetical protein JST89_00165 [Cyanobacteria bacterium SZAS-4]|nr:hypothetical protein [Cyanobacteria bacterium SZAS-4]